MVEAATEFRKSGFNDEDAANMALVATTYQNVADDALSAGEASNFIISQMKAFGIEAENATHIIDALNEVSNNFAVSSSDLSNNIGKASAALATGNTTYEETLGLFTAITEITRNASRAARGLVSIQSRLTQVLDESSSTGKALVEIYDGLGIALYDSDGQLRSLYDILYDLNRQWGNLDTNTKDYIALTQAGSNQTQNFLALMSNFETAMSATATAYDSVGSAAQENARVMESLEARTNQLKATFQDLANNVVENELVKVLLDLANTVLKGLNNEVGQTVIQFGLLTGVLTGGLTIWGTVAKNLGGMASVANTLVPLLTGTAGGLGAIASAALPLAGILAGVAVGGWALYKAWDKANPSLEEAQAQLADVNTQLTTNKARLEEISKIPWYDRSEDILREKAALEAENAELEKNLVLLTQKEQKALTKEMGKDVTVYTGGKSYSSALLPDETFSSRQEAEARILEQYGEVNFEEYRESIVAFDNTVKANGDYLANEYSNILGELGIALADNGELTDEQLDLYNKNRVGIQRYVAQLKQYEANIGELTEPQKQFLAQVEQFETAWDSAETEAKFYNDTIQITEDEVTKILDVFPELNSAIQQNGNAWGILKSAVETSVAGMISADGRLFEKDKQRVLKTIDLLQELIGVRKAELEAVAPSYREALASGREDEYFAALQQLHNVQKLYYQLDIARAKAEGIGYITENEENPESPEDLEPSEDLALKSFQSLYKDLQHLRDMDKISAKQYYVELEKLIADYTTDATAHMKQYGLDTKTINQNMYQYEKEIYEGRKQELEELTKKRQQELEKLIKKQQQELEELDTQKSAYEALSSYMVDNINKEIEALNEQRDSIVEYYDERIAKLQESNDELDRQIELEKKQDALARARQTEVLVYKDGRYQYVEDIDEVSSAKANLEAYEREEALRQEVENLEDLKQNAVSSIDAQIEKWEDYRDEWSSLVDEYQQELDRLLIFQGLGIDIENDNWEELLGNLEVFKNEYVALIEEIRKAQEYVEALEYAQGYVGETNPHTGESWHTGYNEGINVDASGVDQDKVDILGFDPNTDYSAAIINAQNSGASKAEIDRLKEERQNKIEALYGGEDPASQKVKDALNKSYASGTLFASGGLSLVGENGPELRVLGHGDGIIPADVTKNLWAWGSTTPAAMLSAFSGGFGVGKNMDVTIQNLNLPSVRDGNDFVQYMKNNFWRHTIQFATT